MAVDLNTIKALTFDVGGTIFDWHHTIREEVERLAQARGVEMDYVSFTNNWRWRMFELLGQVRSGELPWMNADELHRRALDDMIKKYPVLNLTTTERDELNQVWHVYVYGKMHRKHWNGSAVAIPSWC